MGSSLLAFGHILFASAKCLHPPLSSVYDLLLAVITSLFEKKDGFFSIAIPE